MASGGPGSDVSQIYVAKYNRFVDTILGRINKILQEKYDPVTVKLASPIPSSSKSKTTTSSGSSSGSKKKKTKKTKRRKTSSKNRRRSEAAAPRMHEDSTNVAAVLEFAQEETSPTTEQEFLTETTKSMMTFTTSNPSATVAQQTNDQQTSATTVASELATRLVSNEVTSSNRGSGSSSTPAKRKKNKVRAPAKVTTTTKRPIRNKVKKPATVAPLPSKKSKSKARATLFGLASLKRSGDVSVNMHSDHTTIRTKFNLGPLTLKVEKEFGRLTRKEVRSATATTAEMSGRLSLRVYHGGAATLHSIRVLQPKQMRIESSDDHDRTREFVWRRSSQIANLVSQKLSSATRSMLRPPPSAPAAA